jgi:hypothetical protein
MSCPNLPLKTSRCMVLSHSHEKLNWALAMAGLATQVHALFAVAVALGGARTLPGPCEPNFTDRARRKDLARWVRSHPASILSPFWAGGEL